MKTAIIVLILLAISSIALIYVYANQSKTGTAPGVVNGKLSKCSTKPNCVCSEYENDNTHYIPPIKIAQKEPRDAFNSIKTLVRKMSGNIQIKNDKYFAATFTSAIFGFVDDVEFRLDVEQSVIHIRSSSRVGYSDAGVNKERIVLLKRHFASQTNNIQH